MKTNRAAATFLLSLLAGISGQGQALAQVPANPLSHARVQAFTYDTLGRLQTTTTEPANLASCVVETYTYAPQGVVATTTVAHCPGAPAAAQFVTRSSTSAWPAHTQDIRVGGVDTPVAVPAGLAARTATNALGQIASMETDPRYGAALQTTDLNGLATTHRLDEHGRVVQQTMPSGQYWLSYYCTLPGAGRSTSGDTSGCPTLATNEAPPDAANYVHRALRKSDGTVAGPVERTFIDVLGRALRKTRNAYDGAEQLPAGAWVVQDTVYNSFGAVKLVSEPYFLATGSSTADGANAVEVTMTEYDDSGRVAQTYRTDPQSSQTAAIAFGGTAASVTYGNYGARRAARETASYAGLKTTITNDKGQAMVDERDALGRVVRKTDASGAQVAFQYGAFGVLLKSVDALQNASTAVYDISGRAVSRTLPDRGTETASFDAAGQLKVGRSAKQIAEGTQTSFTYDALGRKTAALRPEMGESYFYDDKADASSCGKGIGMLCESTTTTGVRKRYEYDAFGRPSALRMDVNAGVSLAWGLSYEALTGRPSVTTYPSGLRVQREYTAGGYLRQARLVPSATLNPLPSTPGGTPAASIAIAANSVLWRHDHVNANGAVKQAWAYNGVNTRALFDALSGRQLAATAGPSTAETVLDHAYSWDSLDNLTGRTDGNGAGDGNALSETFVYGTDADVTKRMNRLTSYTVSSPGIAGLSRTVTLRYNALGSLLTKSDVGNYAYPANGAGSTQPHAVQGVSGLGTARTYDYDASGNLITSTGSDYATLTYASYDKLLSVVSPDAKVSEALAYDEALNRVRSSQTRSASGALDGVRTTWYFGDALSGMGFEYEVNAPATPSAANPAKSQARHFVAMGGRPVAVLVSEGALPALTSTQMQPAALSALTLVKTEFWHADHLGSVVTTTNHLGGATARNAYDPYGKRRFADGDYDGAGALDIDWNPATDRGTARGFTGHEHRDLVGIINMNGRVFDPYVGRFLQADPLTTEPGNTQGWNRYAYLNGNPLNATDPSGYSSITNKKRKDIGNLSFGWTSRAHSSGTNYIANNGSMWAGSGGGAELNSSSIYGSGVLVASSDNSIAINALDSGANSSRVMIYGKKLPPTPLADEPVMPIDQAGRPTGGLQVTQRAAREFYNGLTSGNPGSSQYLWAYQTGLWTQFAAAVACQMVFCPDDPFHNDSAGQWGTSTALAAAGPLGKWQKLKGLPAAIKNQLDGAAGAAADTHRLTGPAAGKASPSEFKTLQDWADKYDVDIFVEGSRGRGAGRLGDDLPFGKGDGTRSDFDIRIDFDKRDANRGEMPDTLHNALGRGSVDNRFGLMPKEVPDYPYFVVRPTKR